jgi:plastocyanin
VTEHRTVRDSVGCAAVFGLLLLASCGPGAAGAPPKPVTHQVAIDGAVFKPDALTVKSGDTVVWTNKDPYPHTVTSTAGGFDSHEIPPDQSWSYTTKAKGEFPYMCMLHQTMHGTLTVE